MGILKKTISLSGALIRIFIGAGAAALVIVGLKKYRDNSFQEAVPKDQKPNQLNKE